MLCIWLLQIGNSVRAEKRPISDAAYKEEEIPKKKSAKEKKETSKYFQKGNGNPQSQDETSGSKASNQPSSSDSLPKTTGGGDTSRLQRDFYEKSCVDLSKALLGKVLVHQLEDGTRLSGTIVETEAYLGAEDKAAHSYGGKKTARNAAMFMCPGTSYVYHIYGTYTCINVSSQG